MDYRVSPMKLRQILREQAEHNSEGLTLRLIDIAFPNNVEVLMQDTPTGTTLYVNVNGQCLFRATRIVELIINDERTEQK